MLTLLRPGTGALRRLMDWLPSAPQRLGRFSALAEFAQAQGIVTFGKADAGFIQHQRAMKESRRLEPKRTMEQDLSSGGFEQIRSADNFRDLHGSIVNNTGELIRRHIVVPPDDEIAKILSGNKRLRPEMTVAEGNGFAVGNVETK